MSNQINRPLSVKEALARKIARTSELPDDNSEIPTTLFTRRLAEAAPPFPLTVAPGRAAVGFPPFPARA